MAMAFSPDDKLLASASSGMTVKLWDVRSGELKETLEVNSTIRNLSFSNDGTFLQTDRGPLYSPFLSGDAVLSRPSPLPFVFVGEKWVSRGTEKVLWLPSEYRPSEVAVHDNIIGFGCSSGAVLVMEFAF
jgi:WD40 repeat protein